MAALAITDAARRPPRPRAGRAARRGDAADAVARGARGARRGARAAGRRRRGGASTTATAPASRCSSTCCAQPRGASVEVANLKPAYAALLRQFDPRSLEHDLDPEPPRGPAIEEIGRAADGDLDATSATQIEFIGETAAALAYAVTAPAQRALARRLAHLRARRRRRAADRRADLVPARHDPRVPVGGADEALRRRDLRRRPDRPVDAARAGAADDGDPARRPLAAPRSPPRSARCASTRRSTR